jgi:hypothetical protein
LTDAEHVNGAADEVIECPFGLAATTGSTVLSKIGIYSLISSLAADWRDDRDGSSGDGAASSS